ncbi:helix-turn-helix domain-containing protein [Escherichia coli]|uniref:helix-turn-helix domain-containing protein n=1 Tax=Escherichia coli TaxID=562 RepID=UPI00148EA86A|nr:AraC family transcriptional regulator [Escherichia coli]EFH3256914.1 helix-turn-helix domain-containing protein [Escherichia coli]EFI6447164.1 helix-turn-helix domain-containing protein [Escherichia coli]NOL21006.1 helix-turn-helix transcriptional regulator [Escherichia coli]NOL25556.1 helix-turn-helix transcriptional regulator [Escherichia coli]
MKKRALVEIDCAKDLYLFSDLIKEKLGFAQVNTSVPLSDTSGVFNGGIFIDELNMGVLKAIVNSSPLKISLNHKDVASHKTTKLFLINTYGGMVVKNKTNRRIITRGDGIILPSGEAFIEETFTKRNTVSIILDVSSISDNANQVVNKLAWAKISDLSYGEEINRILLNYHLNFSESFCFKNTQALLSLLALEMETNDVSSPYVKDVKAQYIQVINYIRRNIKKNKLRLSDVAEYLGVTERMVQYILSDAGAKFSDIIAFERSKLLAQKICSNPDANVAIEIYDSGFNSVSTAYRQFKNIYGLTPRQYKEKKHCFNKREQKS